MLRRQRSTIRLTSSNGPQPRIAVDVMGGDFAPNAALEAARLIREQGRVELLLVGPHEVVAASGFDYVESSEVVTMDDKPARIHREKPNSSMRLAVLQVKDGKAQAAFSAGNTGALLAIGLFTLGRLPGIERPALGGVFPTRDGKTLLIDAGANADVKPHYLQQFGVMGSVYMERIFGIASPRVGLLNVGREEGKGNQLAQEAYPLLAASGLNFVGNIEGKDVPEGAVDVVVCDGFTGNVIAKLSEGLAGVLTGWIREEIKKEKLAPLGALLLRPAFNRVKARLAYADYGGCAPLFGLDGLVVKAHGRSDAAAMAYAINLAAQAVEQRLVERMKEALSGLGGAQE
ncbi:MAG TPA: phosphate acyltransferase PlsX [Chloroflexota bacterium]|nr:phosphate acyltransferase PlsX [Chloroflexota bacterium]